MAEEQNIKFNSLSMGAQKRYSSPVLRQQNLDEYEGPIPMMKTFSSVPHEGLSARNPAWIEVQDAVIRSFQGGRNELELGKATCNIRSLCRRIAPQVILDYFAEKLLKKGFKILLRRVHDRGSEDAEETVDGLLSAWRFFHRQLIFELECLLQPLEFDLEKIERILMVGFRNHVLLQTQLMTILREEASDQDTFEELVPQLKQMLLVLQMYREADPPSADDVTLERMVALVVKPYIGFLGVYNGHEEPEFKADVPEISRLQTKKRPRTFILRKSLYKDPDDQSTTLPTLIVVSGHETVEDCELRASSITARPRQSSEPKPLKPESVTFFA